MSISERITDHWPVTEAQLHKLEEAFYERAKDRAIQDCLADTYRMYAAGEPIPTPDDVDALENDILERYVAAKVVIRLIPIARDHYMQERTSKSQSGNFSGSISASYQKKTDELDKLFDAMNIEIQQVLPGVIDTLVPVAPSPGSNSSAPFAEFPADRVVDPLLGYNQRLYGRRY